MFNFRVVRAVLSVGQCHCTVICLSIKYEPSLTVPFWLSDSVLHSQHELFYAPCRDIIIHLEHRWEQRIVTWNQRHYSHWVQYTPSYIACNRNNIQNSCTLSFCNHVYSSYTCITILLTFLAEFCLFLTVILIHSAVSKPWAINLYMFYPFFLDPSL